MEIVLDVGDVSIDVIRKDIKNLHLSVHPPTGRVRIAAPARTSLDAIRAFAIAHVGWIRRNQRKIKMQEREPPREYVDRESHFVWGERVMLHVVERDGPPSIVRRHRTLILQVRPGTTVGEKQRVMESWYRDEVRRAAAPVRAKWEEHLGVAVRQTFVQRMKTKWGSCNPLTSNVRLNTDLGKKPPECLDYVVLHELAHLRERTHSPEFFALLDHSMPQWREVRRMLNDLPLTSQSQQHNSGCKIKSA
jgi:predicted metal-dependent hydrolase